MKRSFERAPAMPFERPVPDVAPGVILLVHHQLGRGGPFPGARAIEGVEVIAARRRRPKVHQLP